MEEDPDSDEGTVDREEAELLSNKEVEDPERLHLTVWRLRGNLS